jgi:hypothetical protein
MKLAVYNYWTWLPGEGLDKVALDKRSREQIEAIGGIPILVTRQIVNESELSQEGAFRSAAEAGKGRLQNRPDS